MKNLISDIKFALKRKCPVCRQGNLFESWLNFTPKKKCDNCTTALRGQDVGDGAIVVLIFFLGFTIIPAALIWEVVSQPSLGLQIIVWGFVCLLAIFLLTPPLKAYIMLLQYRHRKSDWHE